jgi:hypothetical protein
MRRCVFISSSALVVLLAGCPKLTIGDGTSGGDSSSAESANCSPLDGLYRFQYRKLAGTCDDLPEELLQFTQGRLATAATHTCQAGGAAMVSPCDFQLDRGCTVSDALSGSLLGMSRVTGVLSELVDNTSLEGTIDFTLTDTTGATCKSTFDVTGTRVH